MQKRLLMLALVFLVACTPVTQSPTSQNQPSSPQANEAVEKLGTLCSGREQCIAYCETERPRCESYCRGTYSDLCRTIFPPRPDDRGPQTVSGCKGTGTVQFTAPPMNIEDIELIEPIGLMIGGHVTPIDHGYYYANTWTTPGSREDVSEFVPVYAPADGVVTSLEAMSQVYQSSSVGDYRIVIHHTCSLYTIYIHVNQLSEKLRTAVETRKPVEVKAGEVIGSAPGFDFSVHNDDITLPGFVVPESYIGEPWKLHNVDMFDAFAEPVRTQLLEKNVRQAEPRGGKIDYDIDGKLVGNWFVEDTNGYAGVFDRDDHYGYWNTHLAFAYDGIEPSLIIVSMGNYAGEPAQFAVKGNAPDPKDIDASDGLVKYELVSFDYRTVDGQMWDRVTFAKIGKAFGGTSVQGVALVQMFEDRKVKFESFPGKTAMEVNGFTDAAKTYER
ncbi:hypothetical protein HY492_02830 [Candidatus Woesearchaeota archaeon]|nr:hypothetical protein [Candidatus Woesearchaeota archaeon]